MDTNPVTVSIILPVYNVESYLKACLESLAAQTFTDFEVVMVDDGSTDGSADICRDMAARDPRFRLISQPNGGLASARNFGMAFARGTLIGFVDSDDVVHPRYLATMVAMLSRKEYSLVGVGIARFTDRLPIINPIARHNSHYSGRDALITMLYQTGAINSSSCAKLFRRELIADIPFREGILYEDLEWMPRVLDALPRSKRVLIADAPLYFYRRRPGSSIQAFTPRRLDVLTVTADIEARALASGAAPLIRAARDRRFAANFDMYLQLPASTLADTSPHGTSLHDTSLHDTRLECWRQIKRLRLGSLLNPRVRRKNRLGSLLSLLGPRLTLLIGAPLLHRLKH